MSFTSSWESLVIQVYGRQKSHCEGNADIIHPHERTSSCQSCHPNGFPVQFVFGTPQVRSESGATADPTIRTVRTAKEA